MADAERAAAGMSFAHAGRRDQPARSTEDTSRSAAVGAPPLDVDDVEFISAA